LSISKNDRARLLLDDLDLRRSLWSTVIRIENSMYDLHDLFTRISQKLSSSPQLSLEELSLDIQIERHTIERAVRAGAGTTFRDLRKRSMLNAARRMLLENPHWSLKEVAYALGYRSLSAFSRSIKCAAGCAPSALRGQSVAKILDNHETSVQPVLTSILNSENE